MNKKGFTLIEIIVSVGLLALIGVAVGISLNKTFKNQEKMNYQEYVDKVKSAALLYANNTTQIINELNSNASFKILRVEELINNGYINKSLENPKTKAKIKDDEEVRIYYNENNEMMVEYPYTKKDEIYLYAMNYSTTYQNQESDLCYKGKNTSTLQIVTFEGEGAGIELKPNENIKAYMEDGSLCYDPTTNKSKIDTSKIGTYKIRYEYTTDGKSLEESENKKTAERTITVKPSKPKINVFKVEYQDDVNNINFDPYKARLTLNVEDVVDSNVKVKYCLATVNNINVCKDNGIGLENTWIDIESNKNSIIDFDIREKYSSIKDKNDVMFYVFAKNSFEEHDSKENESGKYIMKNKVTLIYTYDSAKTPTFDTKELYVVRGSNLANILNDNEEENAKFAFEGWFTGKDGTGEDANTIKRVLDDLTLYAKWYKYCSEKVYVRTDPCSESCGGGHYIKYYNDKHYSKHSCNETHSCNTEPCETSGGGSSSGGGGGCNCSAGGYSTMEKCEIAEGKGKCCKSGTSSYCPA